MVIVLVADCFVDRRNGMAVSANNLCKELRKKGHEVRIVAPFVEGDGAFAVRERWIPLVTYVSHKQHMHFGEPQKEVLRAAFEGADLVHFFLPFKLEIIGLKVAQEMKIPFIAGYHLQPENITYNAHMTKIPFIHEFIFWMFLSRFYKHVRHIHCPSKLIADELTKHGYTHANLKVISNGFTPRLQVERKICDDGFFHILMTGRYSQEKRQDVLINAVALSKYERQIKLHVKGHGAREDEYKKLAQKLTNGADIGYASDEELAHLLSIAHLYVHTSDVDGESISTLEAISNGIVPIISDSKASAAKQFALSEESLFTSGDSEDLAKKIDYFIENKASLNELSRAYKQKAKEYDISLCVDLMIDFYKQAIADFAR